MRNSILGFQAVLCLVFCCENLQAQNSSRGETVSPPLHRYVMDPARSSISLVAKAGLGRAVTKRVRFHSVAGHLVSDGRRVVGDSLVTKIGTASADAGKSIDTFFLKNKILKSSKYPTINLRTVKINPNSARDQSYTVNAVMNLTGVTRNETYTVQFQFRGNEIHCRSKSFRIKKSDYKMNPGGIKMEEDIEIRFDIVYRKVR